MDHGIDYADRMHRAMRGLIAGVLSDVAERGLPGAHHFFITFDTHHPGVAIADWLTERYPDEMTIVLQHWFDGLQVDEHGFEVTLNFGNQPERLIIPFDAIRAFADPSAEFGLRFEAGEDEDGTEDNPGADRDITDGTDEDDAQPRQDAEIVSLDSFRK
jgi:hypothetical protein